MANPLYRHISSQLTHHHPHRLLALSFSSSSSSSSSPSPLISTAISILTNHRSKSRWTRLHSILPSSGLTPDQFSQITLHLKNNSHLALRFYLFTTQHHHNSHNLHSLSTIIHVLARGRLKSHARDLIRIAIRSPGSDPIKVFRALVKSYTQCGSAPFVFDLLVMACLDTRKVDDGLEIVRMLLSKGLCVKVGTCNRLVLEVSKRGGALMGYEVYKEVFGQGTRGVVPNVGTFNVLMEGFFRDEAVERVEEVWDEMVARRCVPDVGSYCILMGVYCDNGKMGEVERLWGEMKGKGVEPDAMAYDMVIGGFCRVGDVGLAEEYFREMEMNGVEGTGVTYEHIVNGYCRAEDVDSGILVYKDMCRKGFRPESKTVDAVVRGLCKKRRVSEALAIFINAVGGLGTFPRQESYEVLIEGLCEEGKLEEALKLQAEMVGRGFAPNTEVYSAFIDAYMKQGNEEMARMLRKEMYESGIRQEKEDS